MIASRYTYRHGFRASELVALRWDMVDLQQGLVHVRRLEAGSPLDAHLARQ